MFDITVWNVVAPIICYSIQFKIPNEISCYLAVFEASVFKTKTVNSILLGKTYISIEAFIEDLKLKCVPFAHCYILKNILSFKLIIMCGLVFYRIHVLLSTKLQYISIYRFLISSFYCISVLILDTFL